MDRWAKRTIESDAMAAAAELRSIAETATASSPEDQDFLDRTVRVADLVEWTLTNVDPQLVSETTLAQLAAPLRQAISYMASWQGGAGAEFLTVHTIGQVDAVLVALGSIPVAETVGEATAEITSLRRSVGQHRGQVDREIEAMNEAVAATKAAADGEVAKLEAQVEEANSRTAALQAELDTLRAAIDEQRAQVGTVSTEFQAQFSTAQEKRLDSFEAFMAEQRTAVTTLLDEVKQSASSRDADLVERGEAAIHRLAELKEQAEALVGVVGSTGLAGGYKIVANEQRTQADRMRWAALTFGALAAVVTLLSIGDGPNDFEWGRFATRVAIALAFGGLATYAAKQSSHHRERELLAKKVELELASLDPFLVSFTAERSEEIKGEIALRLFAQPLDREASRRGDRDAIGAGHAIELLREMVAKVPNA